VIFKIFAPKIGVFLLKQLLVFCENRIKTLVFEKNANLFAENWQKLAKIVIITSTTVPDLSSSLVTREQYYDHNFNINLGNKK
jgi:hypothetical protein